MQTVGPCHHDWIPFAIDDTRPLRTYAALVGLIEAIRSAPSSEAETDSVE